MPLIHRRLHQQKASRDRELADRAGRPSIVREGRAAGCTGRIALGDRWYVEMLALARSPEPLPVERWDNLPGESETLLQIMRSLLGDGRGVFSVNVPNQGQAPDLAMDAVIECNAAATAGGFVPLLADPLPEELVAKLAAKIATVELTVEAAVSGDRGVLLEALLADGGVTDAGAARALRDDLLDAHRPHLPQFA